MGITVSRTSNHAVTTYEAAGWRVAVRQSDTSDRWVLKVYAPHVPAIIIGHEGDGLTAHEAAMTIMERVLEATQSEARPVREMVALANA